MKEWRASEVLGSVGPKTGMVRDVGDQFQWLLKEHQTRFPEQSLE